MILSQEGPLLSTPKKKSEIAHPGSLTGKRASLRSCRSFLYAQKPDLSHEKATWMADSPLFCTFFFASFSIRSFDDQGLHPQTVCSILFSCSIQFDWCSTCLWGPQRSITSNGSKWVFFVNATANLRLCQIQALIISRPRQIAPLYLDHHVHIFQTILMGEHPSVGYPSLYRKVLFKTRENDDDPC